MVGTSWHHQTGRALVELSPESTGFEEIHAFHSCSTSPFFRLPWRNECDVCLHFVRKIAEACKMRDLQLCFQLGFLSRDCSTAAAKEVILRISLVPPLLLPRRKAGLPRSALCFLSWSKRTIRHNMTQLYIIWLIEQSFNINHMKLI
jgi:hypothetical protein